MMVINVLIGLKKFRLDFMTGWMTTQSEMAGSVESDDDMLAGLFGDDSKDVFDRLMVMLEDEEDPVVLT